MDTGFHDDIDEMEGAQSQASSSFDNMSETHSVDIGDSPYLNRDMSGGSWFWPPYWTSPPAAQNKKQTTDVSIRKETVGEHGGTITISLDEKKEGYFSFLPSAFLNQNNVVVEISETAMEGKPSFEATLKVHHNTLDSSGDEDAELKLVAPVVELTGDGGGEVIFNDFIEIKVSHKMGENELRYTEVQQTHEGTTKSLPTVLECHPEHVDAYFTVDETHITIYTKSFSTYKCMKGHKDQLSLIAWVFCSYISDSKEIEIRLITSMSSPKERLLEQGVIRVDRLLPDSEYSQRVELPVRILSYKPKDIVAFALGIEGTEWKLHIPGVIRVTNLSNIIVCSECEKKEKKGKKNEEEIEEIEEKKCPPDAAVFRLRPFQNPNVNILNGFIHIAVKLPDAWYTFIERWFKCSTPSFTTKIIQELNNSEEQDVQQWIEDIGRDIRDHGITTLPIDINLANRPPEPPTAQRNINGPLLTDEMLNSLSQHINDVDELRTFAITGLSMKEHVVQNHINKHPNNVTQASFDVIKAWRRGQTNRRVAYDNMCRALVNVGMSLLICETLNAESFQCKTSETQTRCHEIESDRVM